MLGMLWLIPILCLAGALLNLLLGIARARKPLVTVVGLGSVGGATVLAFVALWQYLHQPATVLTETYFTWIAVPDFTIDAAFRLDQLSAVMLAFVTFVGFLIHLYSVGYMHHEPDTGYARYFAYLNLFMFSMLVLILGGNLPVLFIGWEGVGLCSYLLIGYFFTEEWCASAGKKAFIVNRIGDFGVLLAMFVALAAFGTLEFSRLFDDGLVLSNPHAGVVATVVGLLLMLGAMGKSAQLPLYVWLPDAMAGPTPVSALIHAATMVTAGVYLVARCNVFFQLSATAMLVVAITGGLTALFAATIGLVQNDIKKVLAYSTVSQLGYMFLAAGVGAYVVAIFHVVTHAFFKACLFLGSGSVIHACGGEQDMRKMGGLKKFMPTTYWTFLIATLAISGVPFLAGFFSKDEILAKTFEAGMTGLNDFGRVYLALWVLAVIAAVMTAFYMFRLVYMTFHGQFRGGDEAEHHLHESPWTMTLPLVVLAAGSILVGYVGLPEQLLHGLHLPGSSLIHSFLDPIVAVVGGEHAGHAEAGGHAVGLVLELLLVGVSIAAAGIGIFLAWRFYQSDLEWRRPKALAERFPFGHRLLLNKYWVDELYDAVVIRPLHRFAVFCWKIVDVIVIDTIIVNGSAFATELTGDMLRFLQTGNVRNYALSVVLGILALAVVLW